MIKTVILDLDGPILDGRLRHYQCYRDILREYGFAPMPLDEYWEMKRNRIDRRRQLAVSGAEEIYDEFLRAWLARIEEKKYLALDRLQPGVLQTLEKWKSSGVKLILVTMRNDGENLRWQLESLELLPLFERVVAVGTEGGEGAKADAARPHIERRDDGSALWIGDTEADVKAARLLGIKICAVGCGLRTSDYLASLKPDFLFSDLDTIDFSKGGFYEHQ